jgi:hypothetical protein
MELLYTSLQDSQSCKFPPFSPVTVLLFPAYLIPEIFSVFHKLFSFPRSSCSITILFVTKSGLKNVQTFPDMLLNLSTVNPPEVLVLEQLPQAGVSIQKADSYSPSLTGSTITSKSRGVERKPTSLVL